MARRVTCSRPTPACSLAVKCSVCKSVSDTYDPYLDVALEIRVRTVAPPDWKPGRAHYPADRVGSTAALLP